MIRTFCVLTPDEFLNAKCIDDPCEAINALCERIVQIQECFNRTNNMAADSRTRSMMRMYVGLLHATIQHQEERAVMEFGYDIRWERGRPDLVERRSGLTPSCFRPPKYKLVPLSHKLIRRHERTLQR